MLEYVRKEEVGRELSERICCRLSFMYTYWLSTLKKAARLLFVLNVLTFPKSKHRGKYDEKVI